MAFSSGSNVSAVCVTFCALWLAVGCTRENFVDDPFPDQIRIPEKWELNDGKGDKVHGASPSSMPPSLRFPETRDFQVVRHPVVREAATAKRRRQCRLASFMMYAN